MAAASQPFVQPFPKTPLHSPKLTSIKTLTESSTELKFIPSNYTHFRDPNETAISEPEEDANIGIIDFSLLTSGDPDQRSKVIHDLSKACQEWGFFMVVNHGVPERLMKAMMDACNEYFNLTEEEKREFEGKDVLDPIRSGTSFNAKVEKALFWRDFLKVFVHPEFHFPYKPTGFSQIAREYCKRTREVARELLKGISESLGLEQEYMEKEFDLESSGFQIFVGNLYPPCPQPELAMGMPPHSDHGFLTLLIQNGIGGLQLLHNGKWVNANALPSSFLVNTGDHLEILSNGKYKSLVHRAVVNRNSTRISVGVAHGPSLDTIVEPAKELVDTGASAGTETQIHPPKYLPIRYKEYLQLQQSNQLDGKSCLDKLRI